MARSPFVGRPTLWDNLQRCDLVTVEFEKESKVDGAAGEIAGEAAGDDILAVLAPTRERFARVLILGRGFRLPLSDGVAALVDMPLILHDGVLGEALRQIGRAHV